MTVLERPTTRIGVQVTFLEMRAAPSTPPTPLPGGYRFERLVAPPVDDYLAIYRGVGAPWCWWMRLDMDRTKLAAIVTSAHVEIQVLRDDQGKTLGFFEIDFQRAGQPYLSYLGLMPEALGRGLGKALMDAAVACAWARPCKVLRLNTCNADHERALAAYHRVGFVTVSAAREIWNVPADLGVTIPESLRL